MTVLPPPAPFLRPVGDGPLIPVVPQGWETHPAGSIAGDRMEVAFDPLRHDITFIWDRRLTEAAAASIVREGWHPLACTDETQIWSRDRNDTASRHLTRRPLPRAAGVEIGR